MTAKSLINDFRHFGGKHCETASLKKLLDFHGLHLSEEMLLRLAVEKNRVFEEQEDGALERMLDINTELDSLTDEIIDDLKGENLAQLLSGLSKKIEECMGLEGQAFQMLKTSIG